ncbi:capsular biosynthesis protein [Massilia sp. LXY-6]|uniref:capsular biosynthesis protein n=1 Tax=Massilia sp. LXY-6 TaxID=3379823 RepID=UPI003EE01351
MIIIPMLGRSSRFFDHGYQLPKYQLPLAGETVFAQSVRSFSQQFGSQHFVFLVRSDHHAKQFVATQLANLGLRDYRIIEFQHETKGQADSVMQGTLDYSGSQPIIIFNIDTIRYEFSWPSEIEFGDGFLEVFKGSGDGWSFVEPGRDGSVVRTTEKDRISDLCSNGLYGFARLEDFRAAYLDYNERGLSVKGEQYIAPLFNTLIARGMDIKYRLVEAELIDHCGLPNDYEYMKARLGN